MRDVLNATEKITGRKVGVDVCLRRSGDPARLVASSQCLQTDLGWFPKLSSIESIVESAWRWTQLHVNGYGALAAEGA